MELPDTTKLGKSCYVKKTYLNPYQGAACSVKAVKLSWYIAPKDIANTRFYIGYVLDYKGNRIVVSVDTSFDRVRDQTCERVNDVATNTADARVGSDLGVYYFYFGEKQWADL